MEGSMCDPRNETNIWSGATRDGLWCPEVVSTSETSHPPEWAHRQRASRYPAWCWKQRNMKQRKEAGIVTAIVGGTCCQRRQVGHLMPQANMEGQVCEQEPGRRENLSEEGPRRIVMADYPMNAAKSAVVVEEEGVHHCESHKSHTRFVFVPSSRQERKTCDSYLHFDRPPLTVYGPNFLFTF